MLFDLRGRGRRNTVRVLYIGLAVLIGVGLVGFGVGGGFGGGGILSSAGNSEGSGGASFSSKIAKYEKVTKKEPANISAWENLAKNLLHEAGNEGNLTSTGAPNAKGKELYRRASQAWLSYLALNPHTPNSELAQLVYRIYGEEGLNEPAKAVQALNIVVTKRENASFYAQLAEYAYKAGNNSLGDLAATKAVKLAPAAEQRAAENRARGSQEVPARRTDLHDHHERQGLQNPQIAERRATPPSAPRRRSRRPAPRRARRRAPPPARRRANRAAAMEGGLAAERGGEAEYTARLLIACPDRPGIVAAVSGFLFEREANIVSSHQYSSDPTGGRFFMRTEFFLPPGEDRALLSAAFADQVAGRFGMEWTLRWWGERQRTAILVSRQDHCLLDLIWRRRRGELETEIVAVISNHPDLEPEAAAAGIPFHHVPVPDGAKEDAEAQMLELLARSRGAARARALHADPQRRVPRPASACPRSTSITRSCRRSPAPTPTGAPTIAASS